MPKLITNDEQLKQLIPNKLVTVKGETSLFDKLVPFLDLAEAWVIETFTSEPTFNTICAYTDGNSIKQLTARLVVADAMRRAIPSLDVVLTPNGFATVGTQNLVAASKMRVDRLVGSMLTHRDDCIAALLPELPGASKWLSSARADFFGSTLFPDLGIVDALGGATGSKWERYLELRSQVIDLEASLAEEWFSPELMSALRSENLRSDLTEKRKMVVRQTQAQIVGYLRAGSFNSRRLADIVNYIRQSQNDFKEWHNSETAKLFAPPVFRNDKKSSGYFF
ncbi:MAG: hypothetical protein NC311_17960 [Muribaculaceae bacterium]|nr:hypothetical protein [Muribaculaceae bacterium]